MMDSFSQMKIPRMIGCIWQLTLSRWESTVSWLGSALIYHDKWDNLQLNCCKNWSCCFSNQTVIRRLKDLRGEEGGANRCELWCGGDFFISMFSQFYFSKFTSDSPCHLCADGNCQHVSGQDEDVPARSQTINSKPPETWNLHCSQDKTLQSGGADITSCQYTKY